MLKPHYVRDSNRLARHVIRKAPGYDAAMERIVGGSYLETGARQRRVLELLGLRETDYVIDIGAGSGRLSTAFKNLRNLRYLGTDVVPELLDFARQKSDRADWTFKQVKTIEIPERDDVADFVVFFSVFTHLRENECYSYLREAKRVLKQGGTIVVSFLDEEVAAHRNIAGKWWEPVARMLGRGALSQLLSKALLEKWAKDLNLSIEYVEAEGFGQSVCAYRPLRPS